MTSKDALIHRFLKFHSSNPSVLYNIIKISRSLKKRGIQKSRIAMVIEILRCIHALKAGADTLVINHDFNGLYAKLAMVESLDLIGFFEIQGVKK